MDSSFVDSMVSATAHLIKIVIVFVVLLLLAGVGIGYCIGKYGLPYTVKIEKVEK